MKTATEQSKYGITPEEVIKFKWEYSREYQEDHFIKTGDHLPNIGTVTFILADLTPEQRELVMRWKKAVSISGSASVKLGKVVARMPDVSDMQLTLRSSPGIMIEAFELEGDRSDDDIWATFMLMVIDAEVAAEQSRRLHTEAQADLTRRREERQALQAQAQAEREARERAERQALLTPQFDENGEALIDLYAAVSAAAGVEQDTRFSSNYIKRITGINPNEKHSKMFEGGYVRKGTVKITRDPALFLVAGTSGSRKNNRTDYAIVRFQDGRFEPTGITANGDDPGWYLTLEGPVLKEISSFTPPMGEEPETVLAQALGEALALKERGEDIPADLKETLIVLLTAVD